MTIEKKEIGLKSLEKATRFMDNAYKELGLAKKEGKFYEDTKHVSMACGTAYKGVLIALDGIFVLRGIERERKKRTSIEFYQMNLAKVDKKMLHSLNTVYKVLHIGGYYEEFDSVKVISVGFEEAENILKKLKQML